MADILVIDDDPSICEAMGNLVRRLGHSVTFSPNLTEGSKKVLSQPFDIVFLDVRLPDGNGLEFLPDIQASPSIPEVIIMTGYGDPDGAELSMRHGAWDYIQKPSTPDAIIFSLNRALQYRSEKKTSDPLVNLKRDGIIGSSPKMVACLKIVAQVAASNANVLITGETGTGKEVFARAIHQNSTRSEKAFVVVDCASLPENLVESILFGHVKGAYTGADRPQEGLVLQADGGTLFLDEVGELSPSIQKSFLRVLQEREFRPIGGKQEIKSDFRLIAASNRNLDGMVQQGDFRGDLLFRLKSCTIEIPPLREHPEDIRELVEFYMEDLCRRHNTPRKEISRELLDLFQTHRWEGNVRELIHTLETALINSRYEATLFQKHLPSQMRGQVARCLVTQKEEPILQNEVPLPEIFPKIQEFREKAIADAEEKYLIQLKEHTQGNMKEAIRLSGLSRSRLYSLLKKHHLSI